MNKRTLHIEQKLHAVMILLKEVSNDINSLQEEDHKMSNLINEAKKILTSDS